MKKEQMGKAVAIVAYKENLEAELREWVNNARDGVMSPLTFRMGGGMNHMSKEAFEQFRSASISYLKAKIAELDSDFERL